MIFPSQLIFVNYTLSLASQLSNMLAWSLLISSFILN
jgi:hypothetical protein